MTTVFLKLCAEHQKRLSGVPACFQNWGGEYEIIRPLIGGMILLRHVESKHLSLANERAIIRLKNKGQP